VLEVDNVDYSRLEVSSPGLDRPLKLAAHYERFLGQDISLTLKALFQGRKKYQGRLQASESAGHWQLVFHNGKEEQVLDFSLEEVREARLVPVIDFKGRRGKATPAEPQQAGSDQIDGEQTK
jgi:ribosome maturation factor RimP